MAVVLVDSDVIEVTDEGLETKTQSQLLRGSHKVGNGETATARSCDAGKGWKCPCGATISGSRPPGMPMPASALIGALAISSTIWRRLSARDDASNTDI